MNKADFHLSESRWTNKLKLSSLAGVRETLSSTIIINKPSGFFCLKVTEIRASNNEMLEITPLQNTQFQQRNNQKWRHIPLKFAQIWKKLRVWTIWNIRDNFLKLKLWIFIKGFVNQVNQESSSWIKWI